MPTKKYAARGRVFHSAWVFGSGRLGYGLALVNSFPVTHSNFAIRIGLYKHPLNRNTRSNRDGAQHTQSSPLDRDANRLTFILCPNKKYCEKI